MSAFVRACRASLFTILLVTLSCNAAADDVFPPAPPFRIAVLADPATPHHALAGQFPFAGFRVAQGSLLAKWRAVEDEIERESRTLADCRAAPDQCSPAVRHFVAIVDAARARTGRALIGEINRAINLFIRPAADMVRHGSADVWTTPLATLAAGRGDCEDYAIAKLAALREAGIPDNDLRLLIVRDPATRDDHAVAAARLDGRWLLLDNRRFTLIDVVDTKYVPLFVLQTEKIRHFAADSIAVTGVGAVPVLM